MFYDPFQISWKVEKFWKQSLFILIANWGICSCLHSWGPFRYLKMTWCILPMITHSFLIKIKHEFSHCFQTKYESNWSLTFCKQCIHDVFTVLLWFYTLRIIFTFPAPRPPPPPKDMEKPWKQGWLFRRFFLAKHWSRASSNGSEPLATWDHNIFQVLT